MNQENIIIFVAAVLIIRAIIGIINGDIFIDYSNKQDVEEYEKLIKEKKCIVKNVIMNGVLYI